MMLLILLACDGDELDSCAGKGGDLEVVLDDVMIGEADACQVEVFVGILTGLPETLGPWWEELHVTPLPDPDNFDLSGDLVVRRYAGVPELVYGDDGRYYLYFVEGDLERGKSLAAEGSDWFLTHGLIGFGAMDALVSDDMVNWEPLEEFGIADMGLGMAVDPAVIRAADGTWRMYYIGLTVAEMNRPWGSEEIHEAYVAHSDDLIHWTQIGPAVEGPYSDPSVTCADDQNCIMASTGIGWARSTDGGLTFVYGEEGDPYGYAPEFLEMPDGELRMYYNSKDLGGEFYMIASDDQGETWDAKPTSILPPCTFEGPAFADTPTGEGYEMAWSYYLEEVQDIYPPRDANLPDPCI